MKIKTNVKAGSTLNHNETLVSAAVKAKAPKVKTNLKAGGRKLGNHNETLVADNTKESFRPDAELTPEQAEAVTGGRIINLRPNGSGVPATGSGIPTQILA